MSKETFMLRKPSERGQAIILIVFAIIGIIGLTALTVDGGIAYADRRSAQGAADAAAWAAGLENARGGNIYDIEAAARDVTDQNGYIGDGVRSDVIFEVIDDPSGLCPPEASPNRQITVRINSYVKTFFAPVIGVDHITNRVVAVTRACGTYRDAIFNGQAVVSCGMKLGTACAFDTGNSNVTRWRIIGGGVHSDTCVYTKLANSVTLDPGSCLESVNGAQGAAGALACAQAGSVTCTQDYINSIMPENPCDGTPGDVGVPLPNIPMTHSGDPAYVLDGGTGNGKVFCVNDANDIKDLEQADVELRNATLYINMDSFSLDYAGTNGALFGLPSQGGIYAALAIVVKPNFANPCTGPSGPQSLDYRGSSGSYLPLYGTILAPTACVSLRGNAGDSEEKVTINSQIVGNLVTSNGDAKITVNYIKPQNYRPVEEPTIILVK